MLASVAKALSHECLNNLLNAVSRYFNPLPVSFAHVIEGYFRDLAKDLVDGSILIDHHKVYSEFGTL